MPLFTVLLEFNGGTYISQVRSASARSAVKKYATQLTKNEAVGAPILRKHLASSISEEVPVVIDGTVNVWCCSAPVDKKGLALLNVIQTSESAHSQ
jgi:hypothetical protein